MRLFNNSISNNAKDFLKSYFKKENILFTMEEIDIDSTDEYQVKTRIFDLYVVSDKDNEYVLYHFSKEELYRKKKEYELNDRTIIDLLHTYFIQILNENTKYIENIDLIKVIKEKYQKINIKNVSF